MADEPAREPGAGGEEESEPEASPPGASADEAVADEAGAGEAGAPGAGGRPPPTTGEIVTMVAGAVLLVGSILPWYRVSEGGFTLSWSAWSNAWSLMPLSGITVALGVALAARVALERFTTARAPGELADMAVPHLHLLASVLVAATAVAYVLRSPEAMGMTVGIGAGGWMAAVGALALVAGTVLRRREGVETEPAHRAVPDGPRGEAARTRGRLLAVGAGALMLLGTFFGVFSVQGESQSAWSRELMPLALIPLALALAVAVPAALAVGGVRGEPGAVAGIPRRTIRRAAVGWTAVVMLSLLIGEVSFSIGGLSPSTSRSSGFWLMLAAAVALVVAQVIDERGDDVPVTRPRA